MMGNPGSTVPETLEPSSPVAPEPAGNSAAAPAPQPRDPDEDALLEAAASGQVAARPVKLSLMDRIEAFIAKLSTRNHFWHRVCSLIWLPYAFKSGIRMKRVDEATFAAELPFRRFNRNWYNAMAGAALLANSEIAGGMYIFGITGGDYTIVCKKLTYDFLRPCFGPALYKITPKEDIKALLAQGKEFNLTLDLEVVQQAMLPERLARKGKKDSVLAKLGGKERRVGRCTATFHLTPTSHLKAKHGDTRAVGRQSAFASKA